MTRPTYTYVYILQSERNPSHSYIGLTTDLATRLSAHNAGRSAHTTRHRPWRLRAAVAFICRKKAVAFERYLKTHSGRAFTKRHF